MTERDAAKYSRNLRVVNLHHEGNQIRLRIVEDEAPAPDARNVEPSLEDLFLYHFSDDMQNEGVKMMKSLVKFEFLKILRKKSTLIVMAVSLLITAVFFVMPILQFQIYNQDGVLRGLEELHTKKSSTQKSLSP